MKSKSTTLGKRFRSTNRSVIVLLMLFVYLAATNFDLIHDSIHDHARVELHTPAAEKDPCHRSIYHHDKESGCDHNAHFTSSEKCKCSIAFQPNQLTTLDAIISKISFEGQCDLSLYCFAPSKEACLSHSLRGPPAA